jgi:hypothetical protein
MTRIRFDESGAAAPLSARHQGSPVNAGIVGGSRGRRVAPLRVAVDDSGYVEETHDR